MIHLHKFLYYVSAKKTTYLFKAPYWTQLKVKEIILTIV